MSSALHRFHQGVGSHRRALSASLLCLTLIATPKLPAQIMQDHHELRELSGIVTDPGHEPLRGAIVQLEEEGTHEVVTYLTEADGRYHFKRLNSNADYEVWVVFRKRHSKHHEISKFDGQMNKVIDFTIEAF